ncbi:MAG TPA: ATP synthase F1 subunit gamma [Candidatus Saccharimonadales bacterium]|nr:ATP synthase F1 subunit gamma [Candidatus Saccharimonadales bacterium]
MANTQGLKRRIRSVGNTRQITKAMEMVSAAKMRRVQEVAAKSRIYSDATIAVLRKLSGSVEAAHHPYFSPPASKAKLYVVFTSDSGLAGAYNSNVFNFAHAAFAEDASKGIEPQVIAIGRKGASHFSHGTNIRLVGEYENMPDNPDVNIFASLLEIMTSGITNGEFSAVNLIYNEFRSTMNQKPVSLQLIPIATPDDSTETENENEVVFEFEPTVESVLEEALKLYFESSLRRARIEAAASEHAMRMMSMNNANRNAGELIDNLTLELNATRQAAITQEMAEIIGGANAIA